MNNLITIKNLTKKYKLWWVDFEVLKWINLEINKWEFVSIMWQSGSGKSTLMNIIGMLDIPTTWEYFFDSKNVSEISEDEQALIRRENLWFIFQNYNLLPKTSALKQVMLPLMYQWVPLKEREHRAYEALKKVGLQDKINNLTNEMSGWQQQRVAIARAIVTNPLLILWDEPTWALDSRTWVEIMELIRELNSEWKTILIITHSPEVNEYADRSILIKDWLITKCLDKDCKIIA